jgi:NTE family protein
MTRVAIACQGGGSHTAFTAGALGPLLRSEHEIVGLSGTSGGAMCAFLAWYALKTEQRAEGPALLERFWAAMAAEGLADRVANDAAVATEQLQGGLLPTPANPMAAATGRARLAGAVRAVADLDDRRLDARVDQLPLLLVSAVEVCTGAFTLFRNREVTLEALLASAAVPGLFDAVEVGDGVYWDGLLSQNPPVRQLAWSGPEEIWIVQVYPRARDRAPRDPVEVRRRRSELAANLSLEQEVWFVTRINQLIESGALRDPDHRPITLRRIELTEAAAGASRLDRRPALLRELMDAGAAAAEELLAEAG